MTRWIRPPELERDLRRDAFDPVVVGARYRLSPELSLALWKRVCAEAADRAGRRDTEHAEQRFHAIAARLAARDGRMQPDVGRLTRVDVERDGDFPGAWYSEEVDPRTPGRETLVMAEARQRARLHEPAHTSQHADGAAMQARAGHAEPGESPAASEMRATRAARQSPSRPGQTSIAADAPSRSGRSLAQGSRPDQPLLADTPERQLASASATSRHAMRADGSDDPQAVAAGASHDPDRTRSGETDDPQAFDGRGSHDPDRTRSGARQLPFATLDRMERAFGQRFDDVELHADSAEVPVGVEAFTRGRHIYFGRGAFHPGSEHGEHVIAHELAHVAQQARPMAPGGALPTRGALEQDAHAAALNVLAGRAASVSLFAPAAAALGFSDGKAPPTTSARGSGGSPQRAHGGSPGRSSGPSSPRTSTSGGAAVPRPDPRSAPKARPRTAGAPPGASPTSAVPRRGATADGLHVPEAPSALTPAAADRLRTVQVGNQGNAGATVTLPSGQQQTDVGRAAVEEPQAEQDARAQHGVVSDVDDRPPPSPEIEEACARIRQVIRDKRPPDEDKLVEAKPREMAQEAGNQMSAGVEQRAGEVREGYAGVQQPPPGSPSSAPVPPTLPPQHAETQPVDASAAAPDPLSANDVSLDADAADQTQQIEAAGMNTEPGKLVEDGPIGDARGGVDELADIAKTDPDKVIADQAAAIAKAKGDMRALQQAADKALADARAGAVDQMATHTTGVKGSEEQQRAQAGDKMKAVFTQTQKAVDGLLQPLSGDAVARWDAGVAQLSTEFEASLADADALMFVEAQSPQEGPVAATLRDQLVAAVTSERVAADALAAAAPSTATRVLQDLSSVRVPGQQAPVLRLIAHGDGSVVPRLLGRESTGTRLSGKVAARPSLHVGDAVTRGARLHTDDTADLVVAAHHAHAVTLRDDIYFAREACADGTEPGDELLAHELTHVAQFERGELARAASKSIEEGGILDPAEIEAELRAKLATLQLHRSTSESSWGEEALSASLMARGTSSFRSASAASTHDAAVPPALDSARETLGIEPAQLDALAHLYGPSIRWALSIASGQAAGGLAGLLAHADHHCGPSCSQPGETRAPASANPQEVLDDVIRAAIAHTVGFDVGPVPIVRDPALKGRKGEAVGSEIRLEPGLPRDGHGREVLLHEAVHIAQSKLSGPVADTSLVEAEADEVAHAAERGERLEPQLRADPARAYGFELGDLVPDISPVDLLRKFSPDVAHFVDQGLDGFMNQLGQGANKLFREVLEGLGVDKFVDGFKSITAAVGPGTTTFGVLTGCCECLDHALDKLGGKLDSFLASDNAKKLQNAIGNAQDSERNAMLDNASSFFDLLHKIGGPILGVIEKAAAGIEWLKGKVGPLAQKVWSYICRALGLDASLPPLEAIKKKLGELWEKASAALAPLRNAISSAVAWLKNASPLGPLFKLTDDVRKLVASVKKLIAAKTTNAKAWLATLAKDLAGTVFEPLLDALMTGREALIGAAGAVASWFTNVLGKLDLLEAWRSSISFIQAIVGTIQSFVGRIKAALTSVAQQVTQILKEVADACKKFYDAIKPLLDFVCGFAVALFATASGNLLALPLFFLGNLWLHVLPDCYKDALVDFCLKQFIKVVQWLPARGMPIHSLVKSAVLAFLNQLLATPRAQKMKAMDTIASLFAGNLEFTLGLIVGFFKGLYDSTIGTVVFVFEAGAWLAQMAVEVAMFVGHSIPDILRGGGLVDFMSDAGESTEGVEAMERDLAGGKPAAAPAKQDEDAEEDAEAELGTDELLDDTPQEDSDPTNSGDEPAVLSGAEEVAGDAGSSTGPAIDDGRIDPPPPIPGDLLNGRALFDAVFKHGVTRQDLDELLNAFSTGLEPMAAKAGATVAKKLISALNQAGAAYDIGETVGRIIGVITAEVVIAVFTAGAGLAKTAVTLTKFAVKLAKSLPRLMKMVKGLLDAVKPLLNALKRLKKGIGAWAGRVAKYVDDLIEWGKKNIQKLVRAIKARVKGEKPNTPGRQPDRDGRSPDRPTDKPDDKPGDRKPDDKPGDRATRDANLKLAAERGARGGWNRMDSLAGAVHEIVAVRGQLRGTKVRRVRGIRVEVSLVGMGSGWKIKARASKGLRRATAKSGEGWITRADENRSKWYAIKSEKRAHTDIIDDAAKKIVDDYTLATKDQMAKEQYQTLERIVSQQQQQSQRRVPLRGVNFKTTVESYDSAEKDLEVSVDLVITPNRRRRQVRAKVRWNKYLAVPAQGSTRTSYDVTGPWRKIFKYHQYPDPSNIVGHPANDMVPCRDKPFQPSGSYHLSQKSKKYSGIAHAEPWKGYISGRLKEVTTSELERLKKLVGRVLTQEEEDKLQAEAEQTAKQSLLDGYRTKYDGLNTYVELALLDGHGFNGHHIIPCNWGGPNIKENICVIRSKKAPVNDHAPYTTFFDRVVKPALLNEVYKHGTAPAATTP